MEVEEAIEGLKDDGGKINKKKRNKEFYLYAFEITTEPKIFSSEG